MNAPFALLTLFFHGAVTASRSNQETKDRFLEQTEPQKQEASLCNLVPMFPVHFDNRRGDCPSVLHHGATCSIPCEEESGGMGHLPSRRAKIACNDGLLDIPDCSFGLTCDTAGIIQSFFDGNFGTCTSTMRVGTHCSTACPGTSLNVRISCLTDGLTYPTCAAIEGGGKSEDTSVGKSPVRRNPQDQDYQSTSNAWIIAIVLLIILFPGLVFATYIFISAMKRKRKTASRQERTKAMLAKKVDPSVTNSAQTFESSSTTAAVLETTTQSPLSSLYGRDTVEPYGPIISVFPPFKAMEDTNTEKTSIMMAVSTEEGVPLPVLPVGLGPGRDGVRCSSLREETTDLGMVEFYIGGESGSGSAEQDYNMVDGGRKKEQGVHPLLVPDFRRGRVTVSKPSNRG